MTQSSPPRTGLDAISTSEQLFVSSRTFRVWLYTVSHSILLLRSVKGEQHRTRLDLLFKPVSRMSIPTSLEGVDVRALAEDNLPSEMAATLAACRPGSRLFSLSGESLRSWVVSGVVAWHEDDGDDNVPSYFDVPRVVWEP